MQFGRDVLRNKGGTDLDLTILYLRHASRSACEATCSWLRTRLSGCEDRRGVDGRGYFDGRKPDYKTAVKAATDSINRAAHPTVINISYWHDRGYHSFELAPVGPKFLENLGYRFETRRPPRIRDIRNVGERSAQVKRQVALQKTTCADGSRRGHTIPGGAGRPILSGRRPYFLLFRFSSLTLS